MASVPLLAGGASPVSCSEPCRAQATHCLAFHLAAPVSPLKQGRAVGGRLLGDSAEASFPHVPLRAWLVAGHTLLMCGRPALSAADASHRCTHAGSRCCCPAKRETCHSHQSTTPTYVGSGRALQLCGLHVIAIVGSAEAPDHFHSEWPLRKTRTNMCCLRVVAHVRVACHAVDVLLDGDEMRRSRRHGALVGDSTNITFGRAFRVRLVFYSPQQASQSTSHVGPRKQQ